MAEGLCVSLMDIWFRVPLKGYCKGFPKIRGTLFWGPYNKDPTI